MDTQTTSKPTERPVRLFGLCPHCCSWFDCTGWKSLSGPACPRCSTAAYRVARMEAAPARKAVVRAGPAPPRHLRLTELWMG